MWRMNYRFERKQKTIAFGRWPEVLLADARQKLLEARRLLAAGVDPVEQAKLSRIAKSLSATNSFQSIAEEWLGKIEQEGVAEMTLKKARWLLSQTFPSLGKRPISEISAHEMLLVLKRVESTKRYDTANRIRSTCSQVFRYAIATARAERDICSDLRGALITPRTTHCAAVTNPAEAGGLVRAIEDYDGNKLTRIALRLLPHVFVHPGELRWADWSEFDIDKRVWTIPGHKMKMGRPHAVPLSRQAIAISHQRLLDFARPPLLARLVAGGLNWRASMRPVHGSVSNNLTGFAGPLPNRLLAQKQAPEEPRRLPFEVRPGRTG